jgi:hypothetical protein
MNNLRLQAIAHVAYGSANHDNKPPILTSRRNQLVPDWVSPNTKLAGKAVGQGLLVDTAMLPFPALLCPSSSMSRDADIDRAAWQNLTVSGSSYAYFWRGPDTVASPAAVAVGATYQRAGALNQAALSMDINAEAGHPYLGEYEDCAWESHPSLRVVNVSFIDQRVTAVPSARLVLKYPAGAFEELQWFDAAHKFRP